MARAMSWTERYGKPCKIGTIPMIVQVHGNSKMTVGSHISIRYAENGRWEQVLVTRVDPDGYFMADR